MFYNTCEVVALNHQRFMFNIIEITQVKTEKSKFFSENIKYVCTTFERARGSIYINNLSIFETEN